MKTKTFSHYCCFLLAFAALPLHGADSGLIDRDRDGIPDDVEVMWGLNPLDPNDGFADLDADFMTNVEEFRAGTDPFDSSSFLAFSLASLSFGQFQLGFRSVPGVAYKVEYRSLPDPVWHPLAQVLGRGGST